jgi:hypothetical protein
VALFSHRWLEAAQSRSAGVSNRQLPDSRFLVNVIEEAGITDCGHSEPEGRKAARTPTTMTDKVCLLDFWVNSR